ncbi:MAG: cytochrome c [Gammaproteobacteria bacterium]|jgi:mono/diheme cytochrome c family protein|nr:cytochrome c [Gammaproteobacteria bacterium]
MKIRCYMFVALAYLVSPVLSAADNPKFNVPFKLGLGQSLYEEKCSTCHGIWGDGSDKGPPLMHKLYLPSHHGDQSFYRAAMKGVQAHHWPFGDMPPVPGMTMRTMDKILPYVRWLQRENGIY